ncbi:MAG TPA: FAD-dependent oxidoreductase [Candidatus Aquilonibacter sp.]|nr:FAD-dependent oxidoreductase [Candidatus Aquilonibacter sp.]
MVSSKMGVSRREFLLRVGQAGGYSAAFLAMQGLGFMPAKAERIESLGVAPETGKGTTVVILGGGIAGLVATYELRELGYDVTLLEARPRPGGRNWTVRGGDTVEFLNGITQQCTWDKGNYQNVGPARLPSIHAHMLGYCRKFGVPMEVEINTTRSSLLENDDANGGKPIVQREAINDTRGHVSEMLSKCIAQGNLDTELSADDKQRMLDFLRIYGPLDDAGKYIGSDRAGYAVPPGAGNDAGVLSKPIDMHTLLNADFWSGLLYEETYDWQATMMQPVGGMDRIPYAFSKELGAAIKFESPVTEIRKTAKGVRIGYSDKGTPMSIEADFCVCAVPLQMLKKIPNDFSAPYQKVVDECTYAHAYKVAWESRRFWEQDYNIYGGLEFVSQGLSPIWFPSGNLFAQRGVFVSGYGDAGQAGIDGKPLQYTLDLSKATVEKLHPGHVQEMEKPIWVNWGEIKWNEGSWISSYGPGQSRFGGARTTRQGTMSVRPGGMVKSPPGYETLLQPDGPIYFAGDHVTHIVGWQEGAAVSSVRVVKMISERVKQARLAHTVAGPVPA